MGAEKWLERLEGEDEEQGIHEAARWVSLIDALWSASKAGRLMDCTGVGRSLRCVDSNDQLHYFALLYCGMKESFVAFSSTVPPPLLMLSICMRLPHSTSHRHSRLSHSLLLVCCDFPFIVAFSCSLPDD